MVSRVICVAAFALAGVHAASVRSTDSAAGNILSVTGQGSVDVPTSETVVSASVQKTVPCAGKAANKCSGQPAQSEASAAMKNVLDYLKSVDGVTDLSTTNIVLQPQYDYSSDSKPTLTGYQATSSIQFHVDNDEASQVLQDILNKGITNLDSVSFVASDEALAKAQNEALTKAVADAQTQADAVLKAIDASQQSIVAVQVGNASPPAPMPMAAAPVNGLAMSKGVPPPIEAGTQTVQASVTLNIKYSA